MAAVVDYAAPLATGLPAEENMLRNIEALDDFMSQAAEQVCAVGAVGRECCSAGSTPREGGGALEARPG